MTRDRVRVWTFGFVGEVAFEPHVAPYLLVNDLRERVCVCTEIDHTINILSKGEHNNQQQQHKHKSQAGASPKIPGLFPCGFPLRASLNTVF